MVHREPAALQTSLGHTDEAFTDKDKNAQLITSLEYVLAVEGESPIAEILDIANWVERPTLRKKLRLREDVTTYLWHWAKDFAKKIPGWPRGVLALTPHQRREWCEEAIDFYFPFWTIPDIPVPEIEEGVAMWLLYRAYRARYTLGDAGEETKAYFMEEAHNPFVQHAMALARKAEGKAWLKPWDRPIKSIEGSDFP
ncbi:MAG: hypothetical protein Q9178_000202 [Gyalolechia marmorata]